MSGTGSGFYNRVSGINGEMPHVITTSNTGGTLEWIDPKTGLRLEDPFYNPDKSGATQAGWICPKCGRVYGPNWPYCGPCNKEADGGTTRHTTG